MFLGGFQMIRRVPARTLVCCITFHKRGIEAPYKRFYQLRREMIGITALSKRQFDADLTCSAPVKRIIDFQYVFRGYILDEIYCGN